MREEYAERESVVNNFHTPCANMSTLTAKLLSGQDLGLRYAEMSAPRARHLLSLRLRAILTDEHLQNQELAARLGISPSYCSEILKEKKDVPIDMLNQIADALGMTLGEMFTGLSDSGHTGESLTGVKIRPPAKDAPHAPPDPRAVAPDVARAELAAVQSALIDSLARVRAAKLELGRPVRQTRPTDRRPDRRRDGGKSRRRTA